jgi:hypothetical protein
VFRRAARPKINLVVGFDFGGGADGSPVECGNQEQGNSEEERDGTETDAENISGGAAAAYRGLREGIDGAPEKKYRCQQRADRGGPAEAGGFRDGHDLSGARGGL